MASPGFGFSVGDIITVIEAAVKICKACRETGGAPQQFQQVSVEFESYVFLLSRLQDPTYSTSPGIKQLARCCEEPIQQFLKSITKYETTFTKAPSSAQLLTRALQSMSLFRRKAQWAVIANNEVEKLRAGIGPPLSAISLLLGLDQGASKSIQRTNEASERRFNTIQQEERQQIEVIDSLRRCQDLFPSIHNIEISLQAGRNEAMQVHQHSIAHIGEVKSQIRALEQLTKGLISTRAGPAEYSSRSESVASLGRRSWDESEDLQRCDPALIQIFDHLASGVRRWIVRILLLLPYWRAFVLYMKSIPAIPTALLSDKITFMDILGRRMSLSYADFCHWPVFEARLRAAFKGDPGEERMQRYRYYFLDQTGMLMYPGNWSDVITPRSKIMMSAVIDNAGPGPAICPACRVTDSRATDVEPWTPKMW